MGISFHSRRWPQLAALTLVLSSCAGSGPPDIFVDEGACPFECCTYRRWTVEKTTELTKEPRDGSQLVGTAHAGEWVTGITGIVKTVPGKVVAQQDFGRFRKGDTLWVLTSLGEGNFKIWDDGEIVEQDLTCTFPGDDPNTDCWAVFETRPVSTWWVKIRSKFGFDGWTQEPENFGNIDACG